MAQSTEKKNPKRSSRNKNAIYREISEEPSAVPPPLRYRKPKKSVTAIKSIHFPEFHHDDKQYFIQVKYWDDDREFYPIATACNRFIGNDKKNEPSLKNWLKSFEKTKYMNQHLWAHIQESITVTVEPKIPKQTMALLINDELPNILSYVFILDHNANNFCDFDEVDDLLMYYVQHVDVRSDKFKRFFKTTGKQWDLERPKGWVTEAMLLPITSMKYIGMPEIIWMESRLHYYKMQAEKYEQKSDEITELFMTTIQVLLDFMATRIRGTLHLRNEGKIKSFTFHAAAPIMDSVLNSKFREIKNLKNNQKFKKLSSSTLYLFNHSQSETVLSEYYVNRDFNENGIEIFPDDDDDDDDDDDNDEEMQVMPSYTMTLSVLLLRYYRNAEKCVSKHDVVRLDNNNNMTGQQLGFWQSFKSKFDEKDFEDIPIVAVED
eukprot:37686_1